MSASSGDVLECVQATPMRKSTTKTNSNPTIERQVHLDESMAQYSPSMAPYSPTGPSYSPNSPVYTPVYPPADCLIEPPEVNYFLPRCPGVWYDRPTNYQTTDWWSLSDSIPPIVCSPISSAYSAYSVQYDITTPNLNPCVFRENDNVFVQWNCESLTQGVANNHDAEEDAMTVVSTITMEEHDSSLRCLNCATWSEGGWEHCVECERAHYRWPRKRVVEQRSVGGGGPGVHMRLTRSNVCFG